MPILVVLVRDPLCAFDDKYLFTTEVDAKLRGMSTSFSWRWSIEVVFKASKQVMKIQAPQHWCRQGIEKLSPRGPKQARWAKQCLAKAKIRQKR